MVSLHGIMKILMGLLKLQEKPSPILELDLLKNYMEMQLIMVIIHF